MNRLQRERTMVVLTVIPVILAIIGTGALVYFSHRRNQELGISEELRLDLATLRSTLARLEESLANLENLPPIAGPEWEQDLTGQINSVAGESGVTIMHLGYSVQAGESNSPLGTISFNLEVEGSEQNQAQCIALLQESVTGIRLETIDGYMGGEYSSFAELPKDKGQHDNRMKITGQVLFDARNY